MWGCLSPRRRRQLVRAARGREREEAGLRTGVDAWSGRCGPRGDLVPRVTRSAPFRQCHGPSVLRGRRRPAIPNRRGPTASLVSEPRTQRPAPSLNEICNRFRPWQLQVSGNRLPTSLRAGSAPVLGRHRAGPRGLHVKRSLSVAQESPLSRISDLDPQVMTIAHIATRGVERWGEVMRPHAAPTLTAPEPQGTSHRAVASSTVMTAGRAAPRVRQMQAPACQVR
jgi:hypothetical protein